jgi:nicotinamide-nucleotide amidase
MLDKNIIDSATETIAVCKEAGLMVATVESCTGGLVAGALTAVSGSSDVVDRGFVTYSNEAKNELVGVPLQLIEAYGAVSDEVARAMAQGGVERSNAQIAVAITGIAGPSGGTETKPVGLVHFGCFREGGEAALYHEVYKGDRDAVRAASVLQALAMIREAAG